MTVQSELSKGSVFTALYPPDHVIEMPDPTIETAEMSHLRPKPSSSGVSILLVEDDADSRVALARLLEHSGYRVETAANGYDALEILDRTHASVVLLDLLLPGLDGTEVLRRIRDDPMRSESRVVVLTGDSLSDQADWLRHLGAEEVLAKPVDFSTLLEVVGRLMPIGSSS